MKVGDSHSLNQGKKKTAFQWKAVQTQTNTMKKLIMLQDLPKQDLSMSGDYGKGDTERTRLRK